MGQHGLPGGDAVGGVDQVVGGDALQRQCRGLLIGDLVGDVHGLGGVHHEVGGVGAAGGLGGGHALPDGEGLHALSDRDHGPGASVPGTKGYSTG